MLQPPDVPPLDTMSPEFLESGHFWLQEYVEGARLRFRMEPSGLLVFGDDEGDFDDDPVPPHYELAIRFVRETFDRDRLREGTENPAEYTFFGVVPLRQRIEYDWSSIPPVLGSDIWDGDAETFASEDVVERVYGQLGLSTVPVIRKEVPAREINPTTIEIPTSRWADEPAAGVVIRKKNGPRAVVRREETGRVDEAASSPGTGDGSGQQGEADRRADSDVESAVSNSISSSTIDRVASAHGLDPNRDAIVDIATLVGATCAREEYALFRSVLERRPDEFHRIVTERVRSVLEPNGKRA